MAFVKIYKSGKLLEEEDFDHGFLIAEQRDANTLSWQADYKPRTGPRGGSVQIWVRKMPSRQGGIRRMPPFQMEILVILPSWRCTIDGVTLKQGAYVEVPVDGRQVELQYKAFVFMFEFEGTPIGSVRNIKPIRNRKT